MVSLTPFTETGALDEPGLRAHLRRLGAAGIGVYLAGSGSGEGYTLTRDERRRVFDVGVEELGGQVPVRAMGVEPRTAAEVVEPGRGRGSRRARRDPGVLARPRPRLRADRRRDDRRTSAPCSTTRPATSCCRPTTRSATTTRRRASAS